jgi:endonuclease/exonuclease/phosphatase (EEP) superfamily protein YafD
MTPAPTFATRLRSRGFQRAVTGLYVLAVLGIAVLVDRLGDVWWPATTLLFAPRWIWGVPLAVLVPAAFLRERALLLPLAAAGILVLGPILDLRVPIARLVRVVRPGARRVRVMTYNIGGGTVDPAALRAMIRAVDPDVVTVQERDGDIIQHGLEMSARCHGELCLFSRFPVRGEEIRDRADMIARHGAGGMIRYELETPDGVIDVVNVHLATVRDGLGAVIHRAWRGAPALEANTRERAYESELARGWADRAGAAPLLVMGDFNMPVESAIYRRVWSPLTNAFSTAGLGFGSSKRTRWHGLRIDHILAGPGWRVDRAWMGEGLGGDHRPMFAELTYTGP